MCMAKIGGYNKNICTWIASSEERTKHSKPLLPLHLHSDPLSSMTAALTIRGFRFPFEADVAREFAVDRVVRLVVLREEAAAACDELSTAACDEAAWEDREAGVCEEEAASWDGSASAAFAGRLDVVFFVVAFVVARVLDATRGLVSEALSMLSACALDGTAEASCPAVGRRLRLGRDKGAGGSGTSSSLSLSMR